jgi:GxxExxY protein
MKPEPEYTPELADGYEEHLVQRLNVSHIENEVIRAATEVHRQLGPGLLESAYKACLCHELNALGIPFQRKVLLPVNYKGLRLACGYTLDLVVEEVLIVEVKAVEELLPIHTAQLLTYLKCHDKRAGLLINFDVPTLKYGLKRVVSRYTGAALIPSLAPEALGVQADNKVVQLIESPLAQASGAALSRRRRSGASRQRPSQRSPKEI